MKEFIIDFIKSSTFLLLEIACYITAIMIFVEFLKNFKVLDKLNNVLHKYTKYIGISKNATLPLIVGYFIGIVYGSGLIIHSYRKGEMTKKDVYLVSVFLAIAHAIIEDTLLFARFGANFYIIFFVRTLLAIIVTYLVNVYFNYINFK